MTFTTSIAYMAGRSITKLTGRSEPQFTGIAIQQAFTMLFVMATKTTYDSLPLNVKRYLPQSEIGYLLASFFAGEIIGEQIANHIGYEAPAYLFPLGFSSLVLMDKIME